MMMQFDRCNNNNNNYRDTALTMPSSVLTVYINLSSCGHNNCHVGICHSHFTEEETEA